MSSCNCNCNCDKCPCNKGIYDISTDPAFQNNEAFVDISPADFLTIADLTIIIRGVGDLYIYLLRETPEEFKMEETRKKVEDATEQYNHFMSSFAYYAYGSSPDVDAILKAWKIYIDKCGKLILLRADPRTKNTLFPILTSDNNIDQLLM